MKTIIEVHKKAILRNFPVIEKGLIGISIALLVFSIFCLLT